MIIHHANLDRERLTDHYLRLSIEDRRCRFGSAIKDDLIRLHVNHTAFNHEHRYTWIEDEHGLYIAVMQTASLPTRFTTVELGLSVDADQRRHGYGEVLLADSIEHCRRNGITHVVMHCLAENRAVRRLCAKLGMAVQPDGIECDAMIEL